MKKTMMLMILDGYGLNPSSWGNAIAAAHKPNLDAIFATYPMTRLSASGLAVGLPEGQMGNSEVGHLNIGAGRIVYQELTKITKAIEDKNFFDNLSLNHAIDHVLEGKKKRKELRASFDGASFRRRCPQSHKSSICLNSPG